MPSLMQSLNGMALRRRDTRTGESDDYAASASTTGTVAVGTPVTGSLEAASDRDWYAISLTAGQSYTISLQGAASSNGTLVDPLLGGVYDSTGTLIADTTNDDADGVDSRVVFAPTSDGTYYIEAAGYSDSTGTYKLSVTSSVDDYTATTATTGTVAVSTPATGNVGSPNDRDWFAISLTAGQPYSITLQGADSENGTLADPLLGGIYSASGVLLPDTTNDDASGRDSRVVFTPETSGTYYIEAGGYSDATGTYKLSVASSADDFAASTATNGVIQSDSTVTGSIESANDVDWFRATLTAGQAYTIALRGAPSGGGTLPDSFLRGVYNSSGTLVSGTENDDFGGTFDSQVSFTPTTSGTYYIAAGGYGTAEGTYTLSLFDQRDDYTNTVATTGALTIDSTGNGTASGSIDTANDIDWIRVTLTAGRTYRISEMGSASDHGTLSDPYLRGLYTSAGTLIPRTTNDDGIGTVDSEITYRPTATGTYYIAAGGYGSTTGTYQVRVEEAPLGNANDVADDATTTGGVGVGGSVTGEIDVPEDVDWYAIALTAGQTYRINLKGAATSNGTLSDTLISGIYDSTGVMIDGTVNDDDGSSLNSEVVFTPTTSGTYYVAAAGFSFETGTYELSVSETSAAASGTDVPEDTTTTATIMPGTPFSGSLERAGDVDWICTTLTAGRTYTVSLAGAAGEDGLSDPFFQGIYDSAGQLIPNTQNDDSGTSLNSQVIFTPSASGTYYLAAGGFGDSTGDYQLSLATRAALPDTITANVSTTGVLPLNGNVSGTIESTGDTGDWYRMNLQAGHSYAIRLQGSETGEGTLANPTILGVYNNRGTRVATGNDNAFGSNNAEVSFTPTTSGTYYVAADGAGTSVGSYTLSLSDATPSLNTASSPGSWTIMVFLNGDNDLEAMVPGDLNEMEAANLPASGTNVVTMVDRHPSYDTSEGDWSDTRYGRIRRDSNTDSVTSPLTSIGEQDMGSRATLVNLINRGIRDYPAQNYGLIVWDHGGGLSGTSWDETSNSHLSVRDIAQAIRDSNAPNDLIDFVGFDTCLQGMVEQTMDLQRNASVVVASEEVVPGTGWSYTAWLNRLAANPTMSPRDLAAAAVETYGDYYGSFDDPDSPPTMSATETRAYPELATRLNAFISASSSATTADWGAIIEARAAAPTFGKMDDDRDLRTFMNGIVEKASTPALVTAARGVVQAIDSAVISNFARGPNRTGLSIYLPAPGAALNSDYTASNYSYLNTVRWTSFLSAMSSHAQATLSSGSGAGMRMADTLGNLRSSTPLAGATTSITPANDRAGTSLLAAMGA